MLLTGSQWQIVFSLNVNHYQRLLTKIQTQIQALTETSTSNDMTKRELAQITRAVDLISESVDSLRYLLRGERTRRGLINGIGYGFKFLFGLATDEGLDQVHKTVEKLEYEDKDIVHSINDQITYTKNMNERVKGNMASIKALVTTLDQVYKDAKREREETNDTLEKLKRNVTRDGIIAQELRELEFLAIQIQLEILKVQHGVEVVAEGRLAQSLITPIKLQTVLAELQSKLPTGDFLISEPTLENMYVLYDTLKAKAYATHDDIKIIISLPIKGADRLMKVYKVHSLPVFQPLIGRHVQITTPYKYLAISTSRQYYVMMTDDLWTECKHSILTVCIASMQIFKRQMVTCLSSLYFNDMTASKSLCRRVVMPRNFAPVWIRHAAGRRWIYSVESPQKVTTHCRDEEGSSEVMVENTGVFFQPEGCQIYTELFMLMPNTQSRTEVALPYEKYDVLDMPHILSTEEEKILNSSQSKIPDLLQSLHVQIAGVEAGTHGREQDLQYLVSRLQDRGSYDINEIWLWSLTVVVGLLVVKSFCPRLFRFPKINCWFPRRTTYPSTQFPKVSEIALTEISLPPPENVTPEEPKTEKPVPVKKEIKAVRAPPPPPPPQPPMAARWIVNDPYRTRK